MQFRNVYGIPPFEINNLGWKECLQAATALESAITASLNSDEEIPASTVELMLSAALKINSGLNNVGTYANARSVSLHLNSTNAVTNTTTSPGKINDGANRIVNAAKLAAVALVKSQSAGSVVTSVTSGDITVSAVPISLSNMQGGAATLTGASGVRAVFPSLPIPAVSSPTASCPSTAPIVASAMSFSGSGPRSTLPSSTSSSVAGESSDLSLTRCNQAIALTGLSGAVDILVPLTRTAAGYDSSGRYLDQGCAFWNDTSGEWGTDGCVKGTASTATLLHCLCTHLTEFGGTMQESTPPAAVEEETAAAPSPAEEVADIFNDINEEPLSNFDAAANANPENPVIWLISFFILLYSIFLILCQPCIQSCKICVKRCFPNRKGGKKSAAYETEVVSDLQTFRIMTQKLMDEEGMDKAEAQAYVIEKGELRQHVFTHARIRRHQLHAAATRIARRWREKVEAKKKGGAASGDKGSVKLHSIVSPLFASTVDTAHIKKWAPLPCLASVSAKSVSPGELRDGRTLSSLLVAHLGGMQTSSTNPSTYDAAEATVYLTDRAVLLETQAGDSLPRREGGSLESNWKGLLIPYANLLTPQRDDGEAFDSRFAMWTTLLTPRLVTFEVDQQEAIAEGGPLKWIVDKTGEKEPKGYDWADPGTWEYLTKERATRPGYVRLHRLVVGAVGRVPPLSLSSNSSVSASVPSFDDAGASTLASASGPFVLVRLSLHFGGDDVIPFHNSFIDVVQLLRRHMPKLAKAIAANGEDRKMLEKNVTAHTVPPEAAARAWTKWKEYTDLLEKLAAEEAEMADESVRSDVHAIEPRTFTAPSPKSFFRDASRDNALSPSSFGGQRPRHPSNARACSQESLEGADTVSLTLSASQGKRRETQRAMDILDQLVEEQGVLAEFTRDADHFAPPPRSLGSESEGDGSVSDIREGGVLPAPPPAARRLSDLSDNELDSLEGALQDMEAEGEGEIVEEAGEAHALSPMSAEEVEEVAISVGGHTPSPSPSPVRGESDIESPPGGGFFRPAGDVDSDMNAPVGVMDEDLEEMNDEEEEEDEREGMRSESDEGGEGQEEVDRNTDLLERQLQKGLREAAAKRTLGAVQAIVSFRSLDRLGPPTPSRLGVPGKEGTHQTPSSRALLSTSGRKSFFQMSSSRSQRSLAASQRTQTRLIDLGRRHTDKEVAYLIRLTERGILFEPLCYRMLLEEDEPVAEGGSPGSPSRRPAKAGEHVFVAGRNRASLLADAHDEMPEFAWNLFGQGVGMKESEFRKMVTGGAPQPAFVVPFKFVEQVLCDKKKDGMSPAAVERADALNNGKPKGPPSFAGFSALMPKTKKKEEVKKEVSAGETKRGWMSPKGKKNKSEENRFFSTAEGPQSDPSSFHVLCVLSDGTRFRLSCEVVDGLGVSEVLIRQPSLSRRTRREPVAFAEIRAGMPEGWASLSLMTAPAFTDCLLNAMKKVNEDEGAETEAASKEERLRFATWPSWKLAYSVVIRDHPIAKTNDNNPSRTRIQRWLMSAISWFSALAITALFFGGSATEGVIGRPFISIEFGAGDFAKFEISMRTLIGMFLSVLFGIPIPLLCDILFRKRTPYIDRLEKMIKGSKVAEMQILTQPGSPWLMKEAERRAWVKRERQKEITAYVVGGAWLVFCLYYLMMFALSSDFRIEDMLDFIISNTVTFITDYVVIPILWVCFLLLLLWMVLRSSVMDPFLSFLPQAFSFSGEAQDDDGVGRSLEPPDSEEKLLAQGLNAD
uniref:GPS domain-containing protein n=1 Tax=Chromera velia CCMP2878 TaxID=1169474 RepID=A0A0G4H8E4_9ALVE|eukprot:Cvel_25120.t1-p1 / transcript=Cvel_25120.t1 / gene=Cvel_25120 / organism=Chromera_velia_CCMP2878 / gene_product=hypothetical protein / transcript_product=hypothetical protein / location=Cvel_scaffold2804:10381-17800(-) / protein_length=1744 / sequence_SO=supercontig / SO=protein_coding / is_pseudo=false